MRRIAAAGVGAVLAVSLTSCSAPAEWAARLNADGSVDYLSCYGDISDISVDYHGGNGADESDWTAHSDSASGAHRVEVAYYAELPAGWSEVAPAADPPDEWTWVATDVGIADRVDLVEGEWVWFLNGERWAWIPDHVCDGWEMGPDGEPRRR